LFLVLQVLWTLGALGSLELWLVGCFKGVSWEGLGGRLRIYF